MLSRSPLLRLGLIILGMLLVLELLVTVFPTQVER
jgi:hypothetical protein